MDVSPSRATTLRKDTSKTVPKLNGEQIFKQKVEAKSQLENASDSKIDPLKSSTPPVAVQTKIPMKRMPASNILPKTIPRSFQRQPKSASKISLTIKEVGGKKLEANSSKSSFRAPATGCPSSKLAASPGKSFTARVQTGFSKRSASTISCRSSRSQRNDDCSNIPPLIKVMSSAGDHEAPSLSARERVAENNKLKVFEGLQRKLQDMQSDFMQKFETLKLTSPEKLKNEYKFITMIRNEECRLIVKEDDMMRMPKKLPVESVNDFKEKVKHAMESCLHTLVENLRNVEAITNNNDRTLNLEERRLLFEREQAQKLHEIYAFINELCGSKESDYDAQLLRMQKEMQENRKSLQTAEKKLTDLKKVHAEELQALERDFKEKCDADIIRKDIQIAELHKKLKLLEKNHEKLKTSMQLSTEESSNEQAEKLKLTEELKTCKESLHSANRKLSQTEQQLSNERKDNQERKESLRKLEEELEIAKKRIEELTAKYKNDVSHEKKEQLKEISQLKSALETLDMDKNALEGLVEKMKADCHSLYETRNKLKDAEDHIQELQLIIDERSQDNRSELPKEAQNELAKLRQSESEKRREIEKLKVELSKAHFNICQLEEQIQRDQQLLEVRSELINSLQTNDNSQRIHLEEMFAQVGEKNSTINELNNELRTKSEEFRNLFTTLSTKQMELSRQEHMIKLLEESNERSQMLRVKQEEKIGRMEEEIAHLKQTISIYQNNVLGNAGCKSLLFAPVAPSDEYNENFYYYTSERRRKRQVDINVKKYET